VPEIPVILPELHFFEVLLIRHLFFLSGEMNKVLPPVSNISNKTKKLKVSNISKSVLQLLCFMTLLQFQPINAMFYTFQGVFSPQPMHLPTFLKSVFF
jgi:hypothetical protein